ncbi:aminoglycoside phosphotransferase family protein [Kribbella antibiotica]|uniref:Aminoglycoside phosphotransferase family protein n=1 Tax=Kribbella antibiotica TaxID=190195 RepID=A0A4R4YIG6_9ACTN|nr:phosphotransferase [Kribbella antibiotica]TDD44576.1 aminoglycoside phosphotransferase family protein [Kribbella antibiotica]
MQVDHGSYPEARTPWNHAAWRREATGWLVEQLDRLGIRETGEGRVRLRPWSVIVRVEAAKPLCFKANPPGSAFEPVLTSRLAELIPDHVLTPYAVNVERAWSLLPDGGQLLRDVERGPREWAEALSQYAELQRALVDHVHEFDQIGVPDARPAVLPDLFEQLADKRPELVDWCTELASFGIPDTLDHGDLHENQIFTGDRYTFFDWGDAVVAHPFCSLLVPLERAAHELGPEVVPRLRDAYLEPWTADFDRPTLDRAADLAWRLGNLTRATSWQRLFPGNDAIGEEGIKEALDRLR